jgi:hypothetical protein
MPDTLALIRHAIEREDFAQAAVLWEGWSRDLSERIAAGQADPAEWAATVELRTWSRGVLLCARAQFLDRLNGLHAAGAYASQWHPDTALVCGNF